MRWHTSNILPSSDYDSYIIIKTNDNKVELVKWCEYNHKFYNDRFVNLTYSPDTVERWAYVEEDDDIIEEQEALTAISAAISHVKDLFSILLTDGICCGKEYADKIGLNELHTLDKKVTGRILELDKHWE